MPDDPRPVLPLFRSARCPACGRPHDLYVPTSGWLSAAPGATYWFVCPEVGADARFTPAALPEWVRELPPGGEPLSLFAPNGRQAR